MRKFVLSAARLVSAWAQPAPLFEAVAAGKLREVERLLVAGAGTTLSSNCCGAESCVECKQVLGFYRGKREQRPGGDEGRAPDRGDGAQPAEAGER